MTAPPTDATRLRPYAGDAEHLADELRRLDLLIRLRLATVALRNEAKPQEQTARAVYVTRDEVDWLLSPAGDSAEPAGDPTASPIADFAALELLSADIDARVRRSAADGVHLAMPALGRLLGLSPDELLAVVICLAPELRRKYDRLYAYLQDDITRRRPSVDLVLELLYPTERERWAARALLSGGGTLLRAGVLRTVDDPLSPSGSSALAQFLALDPGICQYLTGVAGLDPRLVGKAALRPPAAGSPGGLTGGLAGGLVRLAAHHLRQGRPLLCYLRGPAGVGKADLAARVSAELGRPLVSLDAAGLARSAEGEQLLRLAFRDALLRDGAVHLAGADSLADPDAGSLRAALAGAVADFGGLAFLTAEAGRAPATSIGGAAVHLVDVPLPDPAESAALWRHTLSGHFDAEVGPDPDGWAAELAAAYRLPAGRIRAALAVADHRRLTAPEPRPLAMADLYAACRDLSDQDLGNLARKVRLRAGWDDLVLPPERLSRLRDIRGQVRYHHHVYGTWGMGGKVSHGTGLSVLFSGPPGTGKTMAAEVLAGELNRDLYKVDLSGVVSKYIGETEKNLDRIFAAARDGNAILFFDEADALFGKRTEVSDAHDRYANIETSYLLQKLEEHEGLVVLATNLRQNMDDAFTRRLRFIVEFPFPDAASRERIWRGQFPPQVPLAPDVDFAGLATAYPVAGANIRNIALNAAFLAAAAGGAVDRARLDRGARQEFENIGKLWPGPARETTGRAQR